MTAVVLVVLLAVAIGFPVAVAGGDVWGDKR